MTTPDEATDDPRRVVDGALAAGIEAAHPRRVVRDHVAFDDGVLTVDGTRYDLAQYDRVAVLGGGNAGGHVAAALEAILGDAIDDGIVVTDAPTETDVVRLHEGDHPVPSSRNVAGTEAVLELADDVGEGTLVLCVLSGGGSALLAAPAAGVTLDDLGSLTDDLLESGATIDEINAVRKHVSTIKGGRLARRLAPATTVGLLLSDVTSNDPSVVASGPISPDSTTYERARSILEEHGITPPESVTAHLRAGVEGERPESPTDDDPAFDHVAVTVLADGFTAVSAAADHCAEHGFTPLVLSSSVRGEAREAAKTHVAIAEESLATGNPIEPPAAVVSGGETTVTLSDGGDGGPNQEFALSAALELPPGVVLGAVDTDGIDGATSVAGAIVSAETAKPADTARAALASNDSYPFLAERDATVDTGPTGTNVNDLRVMLVPEER